MIIIGNYEEAQWIAAAIENGSDCDNCPIQALCQTVHAIEDRNGTRISDCSKIILKYMVNIEK